MCIRQKKILFACVLCSGNTALLTYVMISSIHCVANMLHERRIRAQKKKFWPVNSAWRCLCHEQLHWGLLCISYRHLLPSNLLSVHLAFSLLLLLRYHVFGIQIHSGLRYSVLTSAYQNISIIFIIIIIIQHMKQHYVDYLISNYVMKQLNNSKIIQQE